MVRGSQFVVERIEGEARASSYPSHRVVRCGRAGALQLRTRPTSRSHRGAAARLEQHEPAHQSGALQASGRRRRVPWHQDSTHRRYGQEEWRDVNGRGSYVQTATALDDVTADSGPIEFIRGSARLGHVGLSIGWSASSSGRCGASGCADAARGRRDFLRTVHDPPQSPQSFGASATHVHQRLRLPRREFTGLPRRRRGSTDRR